MTEKSVFPAVKIDMDGYLSVKMETYLRIKSDDGKWYYQRIVKQFVASPKILWPDANTFNKMLNQFMLEIYTMIYFGKVNLNSRLCDGPTPIFELCDDQIDEKDRLRKLMYDL